MHNVILFCLIVGVGSTIALDLWTGLLARTIGIPATDWGMVGRWVLGMPSGRLVVDGTNETPPSAQEKTVGWIFHYGIGIAYAAIVLIVWGTGFIADPTLLPIIIVGLLASTTAGLLILFPGLGGGLFASKLPNQGVMIIYLIVAHSVFAAAQYGCALLVASLV